PRPSAHAKSDASGEGPSDGPRGQGAYQDGPRAAVRCASDPCRSAGREQEPADEAGRRGAATAAPERPSLAETVWLPNPDAEEPQAAELAALPSQDVSGDARLSSAPWALWAQFLPVAGVVERLQHDQGLRARRPPALAAVAAPVTEQARRGF